MIEIHQNHDNEDIYKLAYEIIDAYYGDDDGSDNPVEDGEFNLNVENPPAEDDNNQFQF
jgi:predicted ATPase